MNLADQVAKHIGEVHSGGNWTDSDLKATLSDVTWQEATTKIEGLNTILQLTFHINYFVKAQLDVLNSKPLTSKDSESFDHPIINSPEEWKTFVSNCLKDGQKLAELTRQIPEGKMWEPFVDPKYGHHFANFIGMVEHSHYHLGQIAIVKKLVRQKQA